MFIDLKKAFDTVDTSILVKKLELAGLRDEVLEWCISYLTNRYQCTIANNVTSNRMPVVCGVPQGSVLGPLFFLIYINDMLPALENTGKVKLYADDTVIYHSGITVDQIMGESQNSLDKFSNWCSKNKLTINTRKTKLMVFGTRERVKRSKKACLYVNNDKLQMVPSFKYLGVLLDSTLTYNLHIKSLIRSILHKVLAKVKTYLKDEVALQIYKSMILPFLDYADVVFDSAHSQDLDKLQRLQNRCLKICSGRERMFSTKLSHKQSHVPFLKDRRKAHKLNFMYKRLSRKELLNNREIRTRAHDAPLFNVQIPRGEAFKRSVGYSGSVLWNELTPATRNTAS